MDLFIISENVGAATSPPECNSPFNPLKTTTINKDGSLSTEYPENVAVYSFSLLTGS